MVNVEKDADFPVHNVRYHYGTALKDEEPDRDSQGEITGGTGGEDWVFLELCVKENGPDPDARAKHAIYGPDHRQLPKHLFFLTQVSISPCCHGNKSCQDIEGREKQKRTKNKGKLYSPLPVVHFRQSGMNVFNESHHRLKKKQIKVNNDNTDIPNFGYNINRKTSIRTSSGVPRIKDYGS